MKKLVAISCLHIISIICWSQNQNTRFEKIGTKEGLSSEQTNCIFQDHRGFIWIGTAFGLNRFDGIACKTYYHNRKDTNSLVHNLVLSIAEDKNNKLWIGTQEGVSCFDPLTEKFINYSASGKGDRYFAGEYCYTHVDKNGIVWIGHNAGLAFINDQDGFVSNIPVQVAPPGISTNTFITSFLNDGKGRFWISTSYGVQRIDKNSRAVIKTYRGINGRAMSCRQIIEDRLGRIFVGTWGSGVFMFDENRDEFVPHFLTIEGHSEVVHSLLAVTEQDIDYLLLGTENGLIKVRTDDLIKGRPSPEIALPDRINKEAISNGMILGLMTDRTGNTWIATQAGINKIDPRKQNIQNFAITDPLFYTSWPTTICEDIVDTNNLWISAGGSLFSYNKTTHLFTINKQVATGGALRDMIKGEKCYWIATANGLIQCDETMKVLRIHHQGTSVKDLNTNRLYALCKDHEGKIWIGTVRKGIDVLDPATGDIQRFLDDTASMHINSFVNKIIEDSRHNIWIGTTGGLYRYERSKNKFEKFMTSQQPEYAALSDNILALNETKDGKIWIGTRQGLRYYSYSDQRFIESGITNLQISDYISGIIEDNRGMLWLATNNGLLQFDPAANTFKMYTMKHGLRDNDISFAFEKDQEGNIYIGSPGMLTAIDPLKFQPNHFTSPPLVTSITIDNSIVQPAKELKLRYDQNISINFVSLNYTEAENNNYAYQLAGFNNDWINIGNSRNILFPGLPPGEYTLHLKAANSDGIWDKQITSLHFIVTPPFWKTWWFISLVVALVAAIVYSFYRYRINQLLRMEKMRTRIATDLHDDIGATLSSISFYSEAVKQKAKEKLPEVTTTLEKMGETSRTMVSSMSDIVWAINPRNDDMEKMLQRMQLHAAELCAVKQVTLQVDTSGGVNQVKPKLEQRRNIYMIFKEALNNALKYSECKTIRLVLKQTNNDFIMGLYDDGKGFETQHEYGGNGLHNMKRRAGEINGKLIIESASNGGTKVELIAKIT